ncbi:uncharacterized protein N7503_010075 [Penicillium pulvis]|uniref:uncharacterized protein n=1 Tax=Penicillium pulvis TaxID=1562058 RepID=UPI002548C1BC|nr:uncharacterized protein N7503_010075 [Penicillium pulvis]KAJ5784863.1 hypothetical protein N7503_010075 [Penicillium pulvis]
MSDPGRRRLSVLFLCVGALLTYEFTYSELIHELNERAEYFKQVRQRYQAILDLIQGGYDVVFVNAEIMTRRTYSDVWQAVVEFVHNGGTAICIGDFNRAYHRISARNPPENPYYLPNPFNTAGLPWKFEEKYSCRIYLNDRYTPLPDAHLANLPDTYHTHSIFLTGVDVADAWYRSTPVDIAFLPVVEPHHVNPRVNPFAFPVVRTEVGRGRLGYVGEIGTATPIAIIMAMAGFPAA